jgi:hypothetical protein
LIEPDGGFFVLLLLEFELAVDFVLLSLEGLLFASVALTFGALLLLDFLDSSPPIRLRPQITAIKTTITPSVAVLAGWRFA